MNQDLDIAIGRGIEKYVNGHLRDIKSHLERQDVKLEIMEGKIEALAPVSEWVTAANVVRRALLWFAAPIAILWGIVKFFLK